MMCRLHAVYNRPCLLVLLGAGGLAEASTCLGLQPLYTLTCSTCS